MKIIRVEYGESYLSESMIFKGGDAKKAQAIKFAFYYIEDGDRRILADVGCDTMPGFDMKNFIGPVAALEKLEISPKDITDVVITHAHHDHIDGVRHFKSALVHINSDDFEIGKKYLSEHAHINVFDGNLSLTPHLKIVKIGGHTKGSCVVEIKDGEKTFVIASDECYKTACLTKGIPTGSSFDETKSLEFIRKYSDPKYTVLLAHDI